jgi:hypothetical protein
MKADQSLKEVKENATWLQGVGYHYGKPAGELSVGDEIVWAYSQTTVVERIVKETAKQIVFVEAYEGGKYERRVPKSRIIAIKGMGISTLPKRVLDF